MRSLLLLAGVLFVCQFANAQERDWRSVQIARSLDELKDCEFIAQVENRFAGGNRNVAQKRLLRQAANRGATHVFLHAEQGGKEWAKALFTGYTKTGEAYRCPES